MKIPHIVKKLIVKHDLKNIKSLYSDASMGKITGDSVFSLANKIQDISYTYTDTKSLYAMKALRSYCYFVYFTFWADNFNALKLSIKQVSYIFGYLDGDLGYKKIY